MDLKINRISVGDSSQLQASLDASANEQVINQAYPSILPLNTNANSFNRICNCKKSKCSKLYCQCYLAGSACNQNCKCIGCENDQNGWLAKRNTDDDEIRKNRASEKACNCKKSGCLKKYCECYNSGQACNQNCKCEQCGNTAIYSSDCDPQKQDQLVSQNRDRQKQKEKEREREKDRERDAYREKLTNILESLPSCYQESMMEFLFYVLN